MLHSAPIQMEKELAPLVASESGAKGGGRSQRGGFVRGRSRGRGRQDTTFRDCMGPFAEIRRLAWRILMKHGLDREQWDGAPALDTVQKALKLQEQGSKPLGV